MRIACSNKRWMINVHAYILWTIFLSAKETSGYVSCSQNSTCFSSRGLGDVLSGYLSEDQYPLVAAAAIGVGLGTLFYIMASKSAGGKAGERRNAKLPAQMSKPVEGMPGARMSLACKSADQLTECVYEDVRTAYECLLNGCKLSKNADFLGSRTSPGGPYGWVKYQDVIDRCHALARGIIDLGVSAGQETRIGIYSQNRMEYALVEYGCYSQSMVLVPLYDTLGMEAVEYILEQAEVEVVVVDVEAKIKTLLNVNAPRLKCIISMTAPSDDIRAQADHKGIKIVAFADVEAKGKSLDLAVNPATPDDIAVLCYTSGTTGLPKGVITSHRNLVSSASGIIMHTKLGNLEFTNDDCYISYLPLAHSYERMAQLTVVQYGGRIGYFGGDIRAVTEDIKALKPTIFATVPRLLNRLYDKVTATVHGSGFLKRKLFGWAMGSKTKDLENGTLHGGTMWDKLVFKNVQQGLGGNLRFISTGSAPISSTVLDFIRITSGAPVLEGYGQTECAAVCSANMIGENRSSNVGPPLPCNIIKLADIPDMKYFAADNKGEVCIKGPNVFQGYFKLPEKTAEALDEDGWLHTGDVGEWTEDGCLRIIDRKKHIFKLAQGEYIAPEKIENIYLRCPAVAQMFVHGDSLKASLVGVAFVDPEAIEKWAKDKCGATGTIEELCNNKDVVEAVKADLTAIGKGAGLHSFEQVKRLTLVPELMTVESGLLTPTMKAKRNDVKKHFEAKIEEMYRDLD